jgi:hypothetical protein
MLKNNRIRNIELGPRQMFLFDIENETSTNQQRVMEYATVQVEKHGQADLNNLVQSASNTLRLDEFDVLQHLFWLTHDLEINFRTNEGVISSNEAKQILIESPEVGLWVVLNKSADETVFHHVKLFFRQIAKDTGPDEYKDQTELARRLSREINEWRWSLSKNTVNCPVEKVSPTIEISNPD